MSYILLVLAAFVITFGATGVLTLLGIPLWLAFTIVFGVFGFGAGILAEVPRLTQGPLLIVTILLTVGLIWLWTYSLPNSGEVEFGVKVFATTLVIGLVLKMLEESASGP